MSYYKSTEWIEMGYWGRSDCPLCGYSSIGTDKVLRIEHANGRKPEICALCVNAISSAAPPADSSAPQPASAEAPGPGPLQAPGPGAL